MSATGRKSVRIAGDAYDSPSWTCDAMMGILPPGDVFDPCCGVGSMLAAAKRDGRGARGLEVDPARAAIAREAGHDVYVVDALSDTTWGSPALVVTNPPYRHALAFVEKALREVARGGTVAMLPRLGFLESTARASFHREHPSDVYVLSRRPSFVGGKTDACPYGVFTYGPGRGGRWFLLETSERPGLAATGQGLSSRSAARSRAGGLPPGSVGEPMITTNVEAGDDARKGAG